MASPLPLEPSDLANLAFLFFLLPALALLPGCEADMQVKTKAIADACEQGAVTAVHHENVDLLASEVGEGFGYDVGGAGLRVDDVGVATQEAEQSLDLCIIPPSAEVVQ